MNYQSTADLSQLIWNKASSLPSDIDLVVGVPRSGVLPASLISLYLQLPLTDLESFLSGRVYRGGYRQQFAQNSTEVKNYHHLLIIDDSINNGRAMTEVKKLISQQSKVSSKTKISYLAIYATQESAHLVDHYFQLLPQPRVFQWNIFHHKAIPNSCFDMDGILCLDPLPVQNDDGPLYEDFLLNAQPLHLPSLPVLAIVTSRLEKYRPQTEAWLKKHHVQYQQLIMSPHQTAAARRQANNYSEYKAEHYIKTNASLFFESELEQAIKIAHISQKPVFCPQQNGMMINPASTIINEDYASQLVAVGDNKSHEPVTSDQLLQGQLQDQLQSIQLQQTQQFQQLSAQLGNFTNWKWWGKRAISFPQKALHKLKNDLVETSPGIKESQPGDQTKE